MSNWQKFLQFVYEFASHIIDASVIRDLCGRNVKANTNPVFGSSILVPEVEISHSNGKTVHFDIGLLYNVLKRDEHIAFTMFLVPSSFFRFFIICF